MKKILMLAPLLILFLLNSCDTPKVTEQQSGYTDMEAIEAILTRKSVRTYLDKEIEQEKIDLMLRAGMAAPSGMDRRPWELVVVTDKEKMAKMAESLPYAKMLNNAAMAIVVCGDIEKSPYWYVDCSAVTQNILIAAEALGLGAVWTATYPYEERMEAVESVLEIPQEVSSLCIIPIGYPDREYEPKDKYDPAKIHYNGW